ncbi:hypothetical protein ALC57_02260 [Trachymyrmex cornetzi]|uniref:Uncharacterized protein n=1 Tax=Trachymyrmex cornetzi TaxID=471704 RepID=A0A195EIW4_9HYME|nr:hypothetical protein ALC57_02260 [Trachymyrmex cornetzi]
MGRNEDRKKDRKKERKKERKREKKKGLARAVTVEGMKEGARASLFRKLKKGRNGHSSNDERKRDEWKKGEKIEKCNERVK